MKISNTILEHQDKKSQSHSKWPWLLAVKGLVVAALSFIGLGTVSALWENPFFIRMTPVGGWEITLLALLSILIGTYVAIRSPQCATKSATTGGVLGFLGIACPVCNKILLLLFGGELLMTYYEPVRIYVAIVGVLVTGAAVWWTWRARVRFLTEPLDSHEVDPA
ncbi:MAG: hypothetical protein V3R76_01275 [Gammaproteobacteria bacterium]